MAEMIWWCEVTELPYRCKYEIGTSSAVAHDACGSRILSAPDELIDPAAIDYEAAVDAAWDCGYSIDDVTAKRVVGAALGVGEPEGSE